jgi:hypothetical protein
MSDVLAGVVPVDERRGRSRELGWQTARSLRFQIRPATIVHRRRGRAYEQTKG